MNALNVRSRLVGTAVVLDLLGRIDRDAAEPLDAAYDAAPEGSHVVLNFTRVSYINSTGIAVIVGLLARARADGRLLMAFGLSEHYREIFRVTRLTDFMILVPDEPSATDGAPAPA